MEKLTGAQRKWLRGQAHALKPLVQIGKQGLTEAALRQIDAALDDHELIKVQAPASKEVKQDMARQIEDALEAETVGLIGHVLILFRENPELEDDRRIEIP